MRTGLMILQMKNMIVRRKNRHKKIKIRKRLSLKSKKDNNKMKAKTKEKNLKHLTLVRTIKFIITNQ